MNFIALVKFKEKPSRERIAENLKKIEAEEKEGIRYLSIYWTLGRYDAVLTFEAPDEKAAMRTVLRRDAYLSQEVLTAVPAEEARKLVE
jgi:uncharacterized protein with GYD domain